MMWDYGGGWGVWMMFLIMIVFVVAIVVAVVFLVRGVTTQGQAPRSSSPEGPSPKDILKRRYAAGEIDREEYLQKLGDLES
jgi:Predicted membrane protein